jgi:type I restriction enzyme R subunit
VLLGTAKHVYPEFVQWIAPSEKDAANDALEKRLWEAADQLRENSGLEQLKAVIHAQLDKLIRLNRTRADYLAKFEELVESYNPGSRNIQELFEELLVFTRALTEEEENLSEEELTVFDILTRPDPNLTLEEREEIKKVARQLLQRLQMLLVVDWRQRAQARAQIRLAIEDSLDDGLPRSYSPEFYKEKCSAVFEHVFETFGGDRSQVA